MNIDSLQMRLKTYSKQHQKTHQFTLIRFFQERLLYRLSQSKYRDNFLLKGGALVYVLGTEESRYTKDIDLLLTKLESNQSKLREIFKEICQIQVADGVRFNEAIAVDSIQKEGQYNGTRIRIICSLGNIKHNLQIDIGVGDYVTPGPQEIEYPTLLDDLDKPRLKAYSIETLVSEKFEAMIALGDYNSRYKDFYDIYHFVERCNSSVLKDAITNTFFRRETPIIDNHPVFEQSFYEDQKRLKQWQLFLTKNQLSIIPFDLVMNKIIKFLKPIYQKIKEES